MNKRVVGISADDNFPDLDSYCAVERSVANLNDLFIKRLPWHITSDEGVIDGASVYICHLGFDRTSDQDHRRFIVMLDDGAGLKIKAYFGWNGSQKQAIEFLKVLEQVGIKKVTAFGPTSKDHWYEKSISPADLIKMLEPESVDTANPEPLMDDHAPLAAETGTTSG